MRTIFTANPDALVAQPGRAVNTFPSGLVRIDETYLGLTSHAAAHRAALAVGSNMPSGDATPSLDGLKIFPEVQERRQETGFTEYLVNSYGRINTTGKTNKTLEIQTVYVPTFVIYSPLPAGEQNPTTPLMLECIVATNALTRSVVLPATAPNSDIPLPSADLSFLILSTKIEVVKNSYKALFPSATFQLANLEGSITTAPQIKNITRNNFGAFDEVTATVAALATATGYATLTINT